MTDTESDQPHSSEPVPEIKPIEEVDGESIAVPAGDLTGAITEAVDELVEHDDEPSEDSGR
jgi:hypothetical protein